MKAPRWPCSRCGREVALDSMSAYKADSGYVTRFCKACQRVMAREAKRARA